MSQMKLETAIARFAEMFETFTTSMHDVQGLLAPIIERHWQEYFGAESPSFSRELDETNLAVLDRYLKILTLLMEVRLRAVPTDEAGEPATRALMRAEAEARLMSLYDRMRRIRARLDQQTAAKKAPGLSLELHRQPEVSEPADETIVLREPEEPTDGAAIPTPAATVEMEPVASEPVSSGAELLDVDEPEETLGTVAPVEPAVEPEPEDPPGTFAHVEPALEPEPEALTAETGDAPESWMDETPGAPEEPESAAPARESRESRPAGDAGPVAQDDEETGLQTSRTDEYAEAMTVDEWYRTLPSVPVSAVDEDFLLSRAEELLQPAGKRESSPSGSPKASARPAPHPECVPLNEPPRAERTSPVKVPAPQVKSPETAPAHLRLVPLDPLQPLLEKIRTYRQVHPDPSDLRIKTPQRTWTLSLPYYLVPRGGSQSRLLDVENFIAIQIMAFRGILDVGARNGGSVQPLQQILLDKLHRFLVHLYNNVHLAVAPHGTRILPEVGESFDADLLLLFEADLHFNAWRSSEDARLFRSLFVKHLSDPFTAWLAEGDNRRRYLASIVPAGELN